MTSNEKAATSVVDILREFERALNGDCSRLSNRFLWHCVRKAAKWVFKQHGRKLTEKEAFDMRWDLSLCKYGHGHFFWQCDDYSYTFPGERHGKREVDGGSCTSALAEAWRLRTLAGVPSYELVPMRPNELMEIANMLERGGRDDLSLEAPHPLLAAGYHADVRQMQTLRVRNRALERQVHVREIP